MLAVSVAERERRTTEATGASMREEAEPRALRCRGRRATGEERGGDGEPPEQHGGEERNGGRRRRSGSSRSSPRERIWRRDNALKIGRDHTNWRGRTFSLGSSHEPRLKGL